MNTLTVKSLRMNLYDLGITIKRTEHGEFRVNFLGAPELTAYYTDDLADALDTARAMSAERN